jgi:macrodomain Ter protein organizer (MatP/YcbG family)
MPVQASPDQVTSTPRTGVTRKRNIRVGDVWDRLEAHYKPQGVTMSDLVKRLLSQHEDELRADGKL